MTIEEKKILLVNLYIEHHGYMKREWIESVVGEFTEKQLDKDIDILQNCDCHKY